jgi:hypothetical protein
MHKDEDEQDLIQRYGNIFVYSMALRSYVRLA